jgi:hypothetical protein
MPLDCYNETLSQSARDRLRCPQMTRSLPPTARYPTYHYDFSTELALQRAEIDEMQRDAEEFRQAQQWKEQLRDQQRLNDQMNQEMEMIGAINAFAPRGRWP